LSDSIEEIIAAIKCSFKEHDIELTEADIKSDLEKMLKFKIPLKSAKECVMTNFAKKNAISVKEFYASGKGDSVCGKIASFKTVDKWVSVLAKVVTIWDSSAPSIEQTGLIGDDTGTIKFTNWKNSGMPALEQDKVYLIKNVVVGEYQGKYQLSFNKNSVIELSDEEMDVGRETIEVHGLIVDVQKGSGLIKRCVACKRALVKGACKEHGRGESTYDLRLKLVLDTGATAHEAILNRERTEHITGTTLEDAIALAADTLDTETVLDQFKLQLQGAYYCMTGNQVDRYLLVESAEKDDVVSDTLSFRVIAALEAI
jgi:replication factor A1